MTKCKHCKHCKNEFSPASNNQVFCSRKCNVKYWNDSNNQKQINLCSDCGKTISRYSKKCWPCNAKSRDPAQDTSSLSDNVYSRGHRSSAYAKLRTRARAIAQKQGMTACAKCGYDKHVEIAHKKAISSFSDDTPVNVINDPDNLIPLCPNCHWEYDHLKPS